MKNFAQIALGIDAYTQEVRNWLHQHPELGFKEEKTIEYLKKMIKKMNFKHFYFLPEFEKGGLIVDYTVAENESMVLFRADIDALPITEATGLPYSSLHEGIMHACGHDTHAAMLMGFMKLVSEGKIVPTTNIRFVFQRAEEVGGQHSGGKILAELGVTRGIDEVHALHTWPQNKCGSFSGTAGPMLANGDGIQVTITGLGGHAAFGSRIPNQLIAASKLILEMNKVGVKYSKYERCEIHPSIINAGTASNIIPERLELRFSARSFLSPKERKNFHSDILKVGAVIETISQGINIQVEIIRGYPALVYDAKTFEEDKKILSDSGNSVEYFERMLGGEDFAYYTKMHGGAKGGMWMLGSYQEGSGEHHTSTFNPNPKSLMKGVEFWCLMASK